MAVTCLCCAAEDSPGEAGERGATPRQCCGFSPGERNMRYRYAFFRLACLQVRLAMNKA